MLPKLYKKRSEGGLQVWSIEVEGGRYRTVSGMVDGAMVTSEWTEAQGKNVGRANATSSAEQAANEAQSKWIKKYDSGYREKIEELEQVDLFKPMLAEKVKDYPVTQYPVIVQPKLDGARCAGRINGLWTRKGKPWVATPHIEAEVKRILAKYPALVLDGELYNHDFHDDFNGIISIIKKQKPTAEELAESEKYAQYHVYDCQFTDEPELTFTQRRAKLGAILIDAGIKYIKVVDTRTANNEEELDQFHGEFMEAGYEGTMIRRDTPYQNKRTKDLLKRKEFIDAEFEIAGFEEGKGNGAGKAKKVLLRENGVDVGKAGIRGNNAYTAQLLKDQASLVGKLATIRYQNKTPDGKLRIGVMLCVRDYE